MRRYRSARAVPAGIAAIAVALLPTGVAHADDTRPGGAGPATVKVSVSSDGTSDGVWGVDLPRISANGRYVAFGSISTRLVPGKTTYNSDIYLHDAESRETRRVSVASDGTPSNGDSHWASISADGRYVAFESSATNLVPGDTNQNDDIFVHDSQTGSTVRVSVASDGSQADLGSSWPSISGDGRYVAFLSRARNLVADDPQDWYDDVFVHDLQTGVTTRVSRPQVDDGFASNSASYPAISADGRFVSYSTDSPTQVAHDTNRTEDVFVYDREAATTTRVSVADDGTQGNNVSYSSALSGDGRYVVFYSGASNLVSGDTNKRSDIFVHDRLTATTRRVSVADGGAQANDSSWSPSISVDGRFIAYTSRASNLVADDTNNHGDAFVYDATSRTTSRASVYVSAVPADDDVRVGPSISGNGRYIAYGTLRDAFRFRYDG